MDKKRFGAINSVISLIIVIALLIVVNILSNKYHFKTDLTDNKIYSLSNASKDIIKKIDDNLIVKCFFSSNLPENYNINKKYLKDLLYEYKSYSNGKLKYQFINPDQDPELQQKLISLGVPKVQITGISSDKFEVKNIYMGVVFYYKDKKEVIPVLKTTKNLEYNISKIIKKLTTKNLPVVGFLSSAGTAVPEVEMRKLQKDLKDYLDVETIHLVKYLDIQDAVDILVVANPRMKLNEWAKYQIDQFIMKGKPVIFLIDTVNSNFTLMSATKNPTNINDLLKKYGVKVADTLIADLKNQKIALERRVGNFMIQNTINYPFYPVFTNINKKYPFLSDFDALYFPLVNNIEILNKKNKNLDWLFKSSPKSRLESSPYNIDPYQQFTLSQFNSGKEYIAGVLIKGKLESAFKNIDLSILKDKDIEKKEKKEKYEIFNLENLKKKFKSETNNARVIVIGDSDFIKDPLIDKTMESFFMNLLDWSLDNTGLINIRSKGIKLRVLKDVDDSTKLIIKILDIFLMPLLLILIGILIRSKMRKSE